METANASDADFVAIVKGPSFLAKRYKKYCTNGYLFVTKNVEEGKRYQNSGVSTESATSCRSSAKDKSPIDEPLSYYGVLQDIIQLEYTNGYNPVLFKCNWVKVTRQGVKCDQEANLRMVNLSNLINSDRLSDEPFILAEHAKQVYYSADPLDPDWHVVLESPQKVYVAGQMCLLPEQPDLTDNDVGPSNSGVLVDEELLFDDPDDMGIDVE